MCATPIEQGDIFICEEPNGHLAQVLLTTCNDRINRLWSQLDQMNEGESILLQSE